MAISSISAFPIGLKGHLIDRLRKLAEKSDHFGFVPDFGIFQNKPNPYQRDRMIRDGLITADAAHYVENSCYDGAIATEYEGQRMVQDIYPFSSVEMVRRHQVMLRRLLGEI